MCMCPWNYFVEVERGFECVQVYRNSSSTVALARWILLRLRLGA